jgi:hypothetical protein
MVRKEIYSVFRVDHNVPMHKYELEPMEEEGKKEFVL